LRGRNRYLSRAMWVKWVPPWRNQKHQPKLHVKRQKMHSSTTCLAAPLGTLKFWKNRQQRSMKFKKLEKKPPHLPSPLLTEQQKK
jgi:hypothetical protein